MKACSSSGTASCLYPPHFPLIGKVKGNKSGANLLYLLTQETKANLLLSLVLPWMLLNRTVRGF